MLGTIQALQTGYSVRPPTHDDIPAIITVMEACDLVALGETDGYTQDDVLGDWHNINPATDAWVVIAPEGQLVGYGVANDEGSGVIMIDGYTHPDHRGRGIGATLVRLGEARAHEWIANAPEGAQVSVNTGVLANDEAAHQLFRGAGFGPVRHFWRMRIDLAVPPPAPEWPEGITVRSMTRGQDERVAFDTVEEAFADHWGHVPRDFAEWIGFQTSRENFDPTLWWLAYDGGAVAGAALCRERPDIGWVGTLAVRRPWRRRGLGMALLRHAFGEFYQRGYRRVGLGVDAQSLTGATHLYEQAGMYPAMATTVYQKILRPGTDLSTQALVE